MSIYFCQAMTFFCYYIYSQYFFVVSMSLLLLLLLLVDGWKESSSFHHISLFWLYLITFTRKLSLFPHFHINVYNGVESSSIVINKRWIDKVERYSRVSKHNNSKKYSWKKIQKIKEDFSPTFLTACLGFVHCCTIIVYKYTCSWTRVSKDSPCRKQLNDLWWKKVMFWGNIHTLWFLCVKNFSGLYEKFRTWGEFRSLRDQTRLV